MSAKRLPSPADVIRWFREAGLDPVFRADIRAGTWEVRHQGDHSTASNDDDKTGALIEEIRQRAG